MSNQKIEGKRGEELAQSFLESKGYRTLAENYTYGRGEIDLIMRDPEGWLVFVEVKTRTSDAYGNPEDFLSRAQMGNIQRTAQGYMNSHGWEKKFRFDVVAILLLHPPQLEHFEDAF